eukprot:TRINITY_DN2286_c0_g1_i1.p1 TRINITY_DN2286_c0_g1~~TRINITY_DN2286_c0_g1_i1.p1  ORF type:complete len:580 (+),score=180.44 TRINITY_DN2286_c0_g1_i1:172-1911(+)
MEEKKERDATLRKSSQNLKVDSPVISKDRTDKKEKKEKKEKKSFDRTKSEKAIDKTKSVDREITRKSSTASKQPDLSSSVPTAVDKERENKEEKDNSRPHKKEKRAYPATYTQRDLENSTSSTSSNEDFPKGKPRASTTFKLDTTENVQRLKKQLENALVALEQIYELQFFEDGHEMLLKDDPNDLNKHWENILQNETSPERFWSPEARIQSLSALVHKFLSEVGESKVQLIRWIASNHLKGAQSLYLKHLLEHTSFQLRVLPNPLYEPIKESPKSTSSSFSSTSSLEFDPQAQSNVRRGASDIEIPSDIMRNFTTHRRTQSLASRVGKSKSPVHSDLTPLRGSPSPKTRKQTDAEQFGTLNMRLEMLIQEERFKEATRCRDLLEAKLQLQTKQKEYEIAKHEDRLHDAIALRTTIDELKKVTDSVTGEEQQMWSEKNNEIVTIQQLQQVAAATSGTNKALPFIQEFSDVELNEIAKVDLQKALEYVNRAKERFRELVPEGTSIVLDSELQKRVEEERWKREAAAKKLKKKQMKDRLSTVMLEEGVMPVGKQRSQTFNSDDSDKRIASASSPSGGFVNI